MKDLKQVDISSLSKDDIHYLYNGLDSLHTYNLKQKLHPQLEKRNLKDIYDFEIALCGPCLDMAGRGMRVDVVLRDMISPILKTKAIKIYKQLQELTEALCGDSINPNSHIQVKNLFYQILKLPVQKKKGKVSVDEACLDVLRKFTIAVPFINHILAYKGLNKIHKDFNKELYNNRFRSSFNPAGTVTGRFSSAESVWNDGSNAQNQTDRIRKIFVADEGKILAYVDGDQAESLAVGMICLPWGNKYLKACQTGDIHTAVAVGLYPHLGFGDDPVENKKIASQMYNKKFSHRDIAKRVGHATNYTGTYKALGPSLEMSKKEFDSFQENYFKEFPELYAWHANVVQKLETTGKIRTFLNRERIFRGRAHDFNVKSEAVAFEPQSIIADLTNRAMIRIFKANLPSVELLAQVHDAVLLQFDLDKLHTLAPKLVELFSTEQTFKGTKVFFPSSIEIGYNWGKYKKDLNPEGIRNYTKDFNLERKHMPDSPFLNRHPNDGNI